MCTKYYASMLQFQWILSFSWRHTSCTEGRALCAALSSAKEKEMQYVAVGLDSMTHLHELVN